MTETSVLIICFTLWGLIISGRSQVLKNKPEPAPCHDFDYLMFSQRWPLTTCTEWEETKNDNTCNLPKDGSLWTIHGVWPTKTGCNGPFFCPSAIHFNPDELTPMLANLSVYWINVEANTKPDSFWAHEWKKHGTCASVLPQLDSVTNYFRMGLKLNKQYDISKILSQGGIIPRDDGYNLSAIYTVVKNAINKEPNIHCVTDLKTKESFISEIRICFNKTFEVIDCTPPNFGMYTDCSQKKQVKYIAKLPSMDLELDYNNSYLQYQERYAQYLRYTWLYNFLKALQWLTL